MTSESEIWKSLPSVPGVEVSTFGRVRTLDRVVSSEKRTQFVKGRILNQSNSDNSYLMVHIPIDGKSITKSVHRLVAKTFIANPNGLPMINHKDCNRANNNVENLEWCDNSYNVQYREKYGDALGHPLFAVNLDTLEVSSFPSQIEASRVLGFDQPYINSVIKGRYKKTHGYWFVNDDDNAADAIKRKLNDIKDVKNGIKTDSKPIQKNNH